MRPSGIQIMGKPSCCSRITGDMAERKEHGIHSCRALRSAFSMMSSVTLLVQWRSGLVRGFAPLLAAEVTLAFFPAIVFLRHNSSDLHGFSQLE